MRRYTAKESARHHKVPNRSQEDRRDQVGAYARLDFVQCITFFCRYQGRSLVHQNPVVARENELEAVWKVRAVGKRLVSIGVVSNQLYPTDLTDSQWEIIQERIPKAKSGGRPHSLEMRQVINAIL